MWAFTLFLCAVASHAVLVVWARSVVGRTPLRTFALVAFAFFACVALFGPREYFGYTSFELALVMMGAGFYVAMRVLTRAPALLRRKTKKKSDKDKDVDNDNDGNVDKDKDIDGPKNAGRREAILRIGGGVGWVASGAALSWGAARGRHDYQLVEIAVKIPGLPRTLDGYTLVQISDMHIGEFVGDEDLSRGLELVTRARGDLLVVTGDIVDFDESRAAGFAARIARIAPRDGIVGILGNHDYYADAGVVKSALTDAGIVMLQNESHVMRKDDRGGFALLGTDDYQGLRYGAHGPDLPATLATLTDAAKEIPRILLAHQPRQFDDAAGSVALQLSGHTHGLQFDFAALAGRISHKYVAGRYEKNGSVLWVNSGFGVTGPPSRVGVPPEITKIVLVAA